MKYIRYAIGVLAVALIAAQFIRPERTNPPSDPAASFEAVAKPGGDVSAVIGRACHDCHSNRTVWPWYSNIAPASWLVVSDVKEGRAKLNFSQWNLYSSEMTRIKMRAICREVTKGEMPPWYYSIAHTETKLTASDVSTLCAASATSR